MIFELKKCPFIIIFVALMLYQNLSWAEDLGIQITLKFKNSEENEYIDYDKDKELLLMVKVSNNKDEPILINSGFKDRDFYRNIKIVTPSGRLLISKSPNPKQEGEGSQVPYLHPLPYVLPHNNHPIRVVPCEELPVGNFSPETKDLRDYFRSDFLELPGYYSAQVQVSAMIFNDGICDVDHPRWSGLIKSNVLSFYAKGRTPITVEPLSWKLSSPNIPVKITVHCQGDKKTEDYDLRNIYLNYRKLLKFSSTGSKFITKLKVGECIKSMGDVTPGKYWITVTGRLKSGRLFGSSEQITIIK